MHKVWSIFRGKDEFDQLKRFFAVIASVKVGWSDGTTELNRFGVIALYWNENGDNDPSHLKPQSEVQLQKRIHQDKNVYIHHAHDDRVAPCIVGLLALDLKKRINAKAAFEHRYFVGIDSQQFISAMEHKEPHTSKASMKRTAVETGPFEY